MTTLHLDRTSGFGQLMCTLHELISPHGYPQLEKIMECVRLHDIDGCIKESAELNSPSYFPWEKAMYGMCNARALTEQFKKHKRGKA